MDRIIKWLTVSILTGIVSSCGTDTSTEDTEPRDTAAIKGSYGFDLAFLKQHTKGLVELRTADGAGKVLVSSEWQGRVMTSTAAGDSGTSFGWINYELLSSRKKKSQFNPVGGEERFWTGPEGGQFSFYFKKGDSFNITNWQVPAIIDTIPYKLTASTNSQANFSATARVMNYSGHHFDISVERQVNLLDKAGISRYLSTPIEAGINGVGYETINTITNSGTTDWTRDKGLISIWLLGMFTPTPQTVVMIPFKPIAKASSYITDNYFGMMPASRLLVTDSVLYFTCDGKYRSKIGLAPEIAKPIAASFDFAKNVLTLVLPEVHQSAPYVNSKWEQQEQPYKGDVINSYNDGLLEDGSQLGPFYEIESSSPALQLKAGASGSYRQVTCHLQGEYPILKQFVKKLMGVDLEEIRR